MSTRSFIGIEETDGSIKAVYCHWDGYPEHNGVILYSSYSTETRVRELIALGDLSVLGHEINPPAGEHHSFDTPYKDVTVAYCRDRGEKFVEPLSCLNRKELVRALQDSWGEFVYLFCCSNSSWEVAKVQNTELVWKPLKDIVAPYL